VSDHPLIPEPCDNVCPVSNASDVATEQLSMVVPRHRRLAHRVPVASARRQSLAFKLVNWAVDPWDVAFCLTNSLGAGDDQKYPYTTSCRSCDALYQKGVDECGSRSRSPTIRNPATERGLLTGLAVMTAFLVWRWGGRKNKAPDAAAAERLLLHFSWFGTN
jgi:hypothetical protein